jgi:uncharacterized protein YhaN
VAVDRTGQIATGKTLAAGKAEAAAVAAAGQANKLDAALRDLPARDPAAEEERLARLDVDAAEAEARLAQLSGAAPDITRLQARHERLKGIAEQAVAQAARLRADISNLDGRIAARGEEGVEEMLEDLRGRLAVARETLNRVLFEKDVLIRLRDALEAARKAARETYFAPVAAELRPLLADLWDEADLIWSDETLLPEALVRKGTEEPIDVLSGGTQEQIAFLVRLAFARLLARSGRHAPLILDDALVYSDDDRIARLFDALHAAAGDLQIIVLSCRQRAFRELGAPSLGFERLASRMEGY